MSKSGFGLLDENRLKDAMRPGFTISDIEFKFYSKNSQIKDYLRTPLVPLF